MKQLVILLTCWTVLGKCLAQQPDFPVNDSAPLAAKPVPDSVRRAIHQLFKRGRLFSTIGGLSGALVVGSGVSYGVRTGQVWQAGADVLIGSGAVGAGIVGRLRYSRRQERQTLQALERGYRLPHYVTELVPLLPRRSQQVVLANL